LLPIQIGGGISWSECIGEGTTIGTITDLNEVFNYPARCKGNSCVFLCRVSIREYPVSESSIIDIALDEEMKDLDELL